MDIFIVGAQKSGTTSLLRYLSEHPEIVGHSQMEMSYFSRDQDYRAGYAKAFRTHFGRHFLGKRKLLAKNATVCSSEEAIRRLSVHNPNCQLILLIRNPVERAYSSYLMEVSAGSEVEPFDKVARAAVESVEEGQQNWRADIYLELGMYAQHLEMIFKYFRRDAVKIVSFDELRDQTLRTVQDIFGWLEVNNSFVPNVAIKHNSTSKPKSWRYARLLLRLLQEGNVIKETARKFIPGAHTQKIGVLVRQLNRSGVRFPEMSDATRLYLSSFYAPYNGRLTDYTQIDISRW